MRLEEHIRAHEDFVECADTAPNAAEFIVSEDQLGACDDDSYDEDME